MDQPASCCKCVPYIEGAYSALISILNHCGFLKFSLKVKRKPKAMSEIISILLVSSISWWDKEDISISLVLYIHSFFLVFYIMKRISEFWGLETQEKKHLSNFCIWQNFPHILATLYLSLISDIQKQKVYLWANNLDTSSILKRSKQLQNMTHLQLCYLTWLGE